MHNFKLVLFELATEKEPAPSANGTSSTVSEDTEPYIDYKAKMQKCQEAVERIQSTILDIYNCMNKEEKRTFEFGEVFNQVVSACRISEEE